MMVGSGMVVKNETMQTQAAGPFVWQSPFSSAWGRHHPAIVVAIGLGECEACRCVDDIEPRWLLVCMEGEGRGRLAYR
jgi:hypothetical protein